MKIRTIAGATKETFQMNYVGNALIVLSPTGADLTDKVAVKVVPLGDGVLLDLDANGFTQVGINDRFKDSDTSTALIAKLANGVIPQKVTDITIDNTDAAPVNVYMPVASKGNAYIQTFQQTILASSQSTFTDFSELHVDAMHDTDSQITIDFIDGSSHTYDKSELWALSSMKQSEWNGTIDNTEQRIRKVVLINPTECKIYSTRFAPVQNL